MGKVAVYNAVIRHVLKYGSETLTLRKSEQYLMIEITEMRLLRWMMEIKRIEKIRKEEIRVRAHVASIPTSGEK